MVVTRKPKPLLYILIIIFIGIILIAFGGLCIYFTGPVDKNSDEIVEVVIPTGTGTSDIAKILKEKNLIRSKLYFSIYTKTQTNKPLKAATYKMKRSMNLQEIVRSLQDGSTYDPDALVLTFKDGQRITDYIDLIVKKTKYSEDEVTNVFNDKEYITTLINKYWFLTNSILDVSIYYPLEGYLPPDTYFFEKDATVKDIIEKLLDEEESNLNKYKTKVNEGNIHSILTMASIVEIEGTNTENRKEIVGIFNNRLSLNMNLGSDVTTYYALQLPLTQDLTTAQINTENPYNTRGANMRGKLPIGPICNPSISSIEASIDPIDNEYLFFVADKNGKIYYTKSLAEHEAMIAEIKKKGDWIW